MKKIEKMGGSVKAIEKGFFQSEIRANAYRLKKETDDTDRVIVGVNKYSEEEEQPELLRIDDRVEIQQKKALKKLRADRDSKKLEKALSAMQSAADTEENLMPYIVSAAKAFATTGEISNTFREVFGEYRPIKKFLDKKGPGLHHMALDTSNIEGEVERMEGCGIQFLGKIRPGSAGTKVTFIHPKSLNGVLAELCSHP